VLVYALAMLHAKKQQQKTKTKKQIIKTECQEMRSKFKIVLYSLINRQILSAPYFNELPLLLPNAWCILM